MAELFAEWDPSLTANPSAALQYNRGCPPNYAAEFVAPGQPMAVAYRAERPQDAWIRCRYVPGVTAAQIASETGTSFDETVGIYTGAVGDTVQQVSSAVQNAIPSAWDLRLGLVVAGIVGIAVLAVLYGPRIR